MQFKSLKCCEQSLSPALLWTKDGSLTLQKVLLGFFVFESFRAFAAIELNTFEGLFHDLRNFAFDKRAIPTVRTRILLASPLVNAFCTKILLALFTVRRIPDHVVTNYANTPVRGLFQS